MAIVFAWDDWNKKHVTKHGSNEADAKYIVSHAEDPFPRDMGDGKYLVWGKTASGDYLEVIFAFRVPEDLEFLALGVLDWGVLIDYPATVPIYICHAMPMKSKQLRRYKKLRSQS
ncbi:MAG: hypothetical protein ABSD28_13225 [Tepidisphaeraceae bacterium]|jgi:hypothetical protein